MSVTSSRLGEGLPQRRKLRTEVELIDLMGGSVMSESTDHTPSYVTEGAEFNRDTNYIDDRILNDPNAQWPVEPGRYR